MILLSINYSSLTHFWPMLPFYTPENQKFSGVLRGHEMETSARDGLNNLSIVATTEYYC